jgi:hypothetical protein
MTHDVLRTDLELAIRLLDEKRPDEQIITALVHRGVDAGKAAQLVADLRGGGKAIARSALPSEFVLPRRSRSKSGSRGSRQGQSSRSSKAESNREPSQHAASERQNKSAVRWLIPAIIVVLVVFVAGVIVFKRYHDWTNSTEDQPVKAITPK